MTSSSKLGLKIKIGNEEKDLDDIFLKISDYNANSSNYQDGEAVQLTQETGIKYIDENGVKRDLIERYIGYDSDGYIADNYDTDPNRIDASNLNAITDINGNNLVNLFYQLGTKKASSNEYKSYIIHNRNKQVKFDMKFLQNISLQVISNNYSSNDEIFLKYGTTKIINILSDTVTIDKSQNFVHIKDDVINNLGNSNHKLYISRELKFNVNLFTTATYAFNKYTV